MSKFVKTLTHTEPSGTFECRPAKLKDINIRKKVVKKKSYTYIMTKTKKIISISASMLVLAAAGYFIYINFYNSNDLLTAADVEQLGLNNIGGEVISVKGDGLMALAQVPDEFTPYSENGYVYVNKQYLIKTSSSTQILLFVDDINYEQLFDLGSIKPGDKFSAVSKDNIMDRNEIEAVEIIFYK